MFQNCGLPGCDGKTQMRWSQLLHVFLSGYNGVKMEMGLKILFRKEVRGRAADACRLTVPRKRLANVNKYWIFVFVVKIVDFRNYFFSVYSVTFFPFPPVIRKNESSAGNPVVPVYCTQLHETPPKNRKHLLFDCFKRLLK